MSSYTSSDQRWIDQVSRDGHLLVAHNRPIRGASFYGDVALWAPLDADVMAKNRADRLLYARLESTIGLALDIMSLVAYGARERGRLARARALFERSRRQRVKALVAFLSVATPEESVHYLPEELRRRVCELARRYEE